MLLSLYRSYHVTNIIKQYISKCYITNIMLLILVILCITNIIEVVATMITIIITITNVIRPGQSG